MYSRGPPARKPFERLGGGDEGDQDEDDDVKWDDDDDHQRRRRRVRRGGGGGRRRPSRFRPRPRRPRFPHAFEGLSEGGLRVHASRGSKSATWARRPIVPRTDAALRDDMQTPMLNSQIVGRCPGVPRNLQAMVKTQTRYVGQST